MSDLLRFRRCCDLYGNPVDISVGKRGGKTYAFIRLNSEDYGAASEPEEIGIAEHSNTNTPADEKDQRINGQFL